MCKVSDTTPLHEGSTWQSWQAAPARAAIIGAHDAGWLSQPELSRRLTTLRDAPSPAQLLSTWLAARGEPVNVSAPVPDALYDDPMQDP